MSRVILGPLQSTCLEKLSLWLKQTQLAPNGYVFDQDFWFYKIKTRYEYLDGHVKTEFTNNKNFTQYIDGPSERKDVLVHAVAWAPKTGPIITDPVVRYYICQKYPMKNVSFTFYYRGRIVPEGHYELSCKVGP